MLGFKEKITNIPTKWKLGISLFLMLFFIGALNANAACTYPECTDCADNQQLILCSMNLGETNTTPSETTGTPGVILNDISTLQAINQTPDYIYTFLQQLPGFESNQFDARKKCALGDYLDIMFGIFIGIAAVLAMIMIVVGGFMYMTGEVVSEKSAGKKMITNAVLGLILAFACYIILNSLNPQLLNLCLDKLPKTSVHLSSEEFEETIGHESKTVSVGGSTLTACNEANGEIVVMNFLGMDFKVNQAIVQDLQNVESDWYETVNELQAKENKTPEDEYTIAYSISDKSYGYSCRHVKNQPSKVSAHSFGIALDINAETNPFNYKKCITNMPPKFVEAFTKNGFGWGGNWSSLYDPMHFSKAPNESKSNHLSGKPTFINSTKILCPSGN